MYTYTRYAYRNGVLVNKYTTTLTGDEVEYKLPHKFKESYGIVRDHKLAFMQLLNHWNKIGNRLGTIGGVGESCGFVYVYVAENGESDSIRNSSYEGK